MNIRTLREPTPEGRLAAVAVEEMFRHLDAKPFPRLPDYADFREVFRKQIAIEILQEQIKEAKLKPKNEARIRELEGELACLLI